MSTPHTSCQDREHVNTTHRLQGQRTCQHHTHSAKREKMSTSHTHRKEKENVSTTFIPLEEREYQHHSHRAFKEKMSICCQPPPPSPHNTDMRFLLSELTENVFLCILKMEALSVTQVEPEMQFTNVTTNHTSVSRERQQTAHQPCGGW